MSIRAETKARTREAILASAARLLRERGVAGARVADVMAGAGLTVGGFYAHFADKKELVDHAIRGTAERLRGELFARLEGEPPERRLALVLKRYLSRAHRDETSLGCPFPAIVGEIATSSPEHRDALAEQITSLMTELSRQLRAPESVSDRQLALGLAALMIGGLTLARALRGTPLSDEVLRACQVLGNRVANP